MTIRSSRGAPATGIRGGLPELPQGTGSDEPRSFTAESGSALEATAPPSRLCRFVAKRAQRLGRRRAVLLACVATISVAAAPALAQAAPYDNSDPSQTGCASSSAYTVTSTTVDDSHGAPLALIELRWSPLCQTNWTRMTSLEPGARYMRGYIDRSSPGPVTLTFAGTYTSLYTNQLYGGAGTSCLYSSGWVQDPYTGYMTYAQTGCY
jgi:hypothetical protein